MNTPEAFAAKFDVSRETLARLRTLADLVLRWNPWINLISRDSEGAIWSRHIADSAQLWSLKPPGARLWADLGAGAGFPGLVIAAFAAADTPSVVLVESDLRKCVFLREAGRAMGVTAGVLQARIEALPALGADVLSARALAPLDKLLEYTQKHRAAGGRGLFPKGRTVHKELQNAAQRWRFEHRLHPSKTEPGAAIVEIGALASV